MSKMIQLVEEMRVRLDEITGSEQALVRALAEALSRVDLKLLQEVRNITTEHESRRGMILQELQGLATRMGAFPSPREAPPGLPFADGHATPIAHANGNLPAFGGADWRQAASNIEDELDLFCKARASSQ